MVEHSKSHTFEMLDVIRGLAAIIVAERHLSRFFFGQQLPGGYFAVDIFFCLSGFVLAHAYEARFAAGLSWQKFLAIRLVRLYPLYLLCVVLGLLNLWLIAHLYQVVVPLYYYGLVTFMAVLFLPLMPQAIAPGMLYPLDYPTWTLLFELFANVMHAILAPRLTNAMLHGILAVSGIALIVAACHFGSVDVGNSPANYVAGIARVCFSYFAGVRLYRLWYARATHRVISPWFILAGIVAVMAIAVPHAYRVPYELFAAMLVIPALIYLAASSRLAPWAKHLLLPLGTASYAYYVLHVPFVALCDILAERLGHDLPVAAPWDGMGLMVALFGVTLLLDRYYDRPLRKWLSGIVRK